MDGEQERKEVAVKHLRRGRKRWSEKSDGNGVTNCCGARYQGASRVQSKPGPGREMI
jgi:hypothetical protein